MGSGVHTGSIDVDSNDAAGCGRGGRMASGHGLRGRWAPEATKGSGDRNGPGLGPSDGLRGPPELHPTSYDGGPRLRRHHARKPMRVPPRRRASEKARVPARVPAAAVFVRYAPSAHFGSQFYAIIGSGPGPPTGHH